MKLNRIILALSAVLGLVHAAAIAATPMTASALQGQFKNVKARADAVQAVGSKITNANALLQYPKINEAVLAFILEVTGFALMNNNGAAGTFSDAEKKALTSGCMDALTSCQRMCSTLTSNQGNLATSTIRLTLSFTVQTFQTSCVNYAGSLGKVAPDLAGSPELSKGFEQLKDLFTKLIAALKGLGGT